MIDQLLFRRFFTSLAIAWAVGEWILACWLLAPFRALPPALQLLALPVMALLNRLAACVFEREPRLPALVDRPARVVTAAGFAAFAGAGVFLVLAGLWIAIGVLGGLPAEAGVVAGAHESLSLPHGFQMAALPLVALAMGTVAHGYLRGYRRLVVTRLDVPITALPAPLAGLRVVHLSDLHLGPLADRRALREALDRVAALDPDVVCVTGDIVDTPVTDLAAWFPELEGVTARYGVFAVLGNHDRHAGADKIAEALRRWTSWRVLRDEAAVVEVGGAQLHVLGLEDRPRSQATDALPQVLAALPPTEPAILLAHRPNVFAAAAAAGVPLVLAGHTHGGQVAVPGLPRFNLARFLMTRFDAGLFSDGGSWLHVSRGLGTSGQPVRVGVPREIAVLTLVPGVASAAAS